MDDFLLRTRMIVPSVDELKDKKVIIFGLGGVGGYVLESLVRTGVGHIGLVDNDVFSESNLNRQILATVETVGKAKTEVAKERALSINLSCDIKTYNLFYSDETENEIALKEYDYIVDAIDSVASKVLLIKRAKENNIPIISSMGTGNKLSVNYEVADIYKTQVCPLAKAMRQKLKEEGIKNLKVVYSKDEPIKVASEDNKKQVPGSICFSPAVAGLTISKEVIKDLLKI